MLVRSETVNAVLKQLYTIKSVGSLPNICCIEEQNIDSYKCII